MTHNDDTQTANNDDNDTQNDDNDYNDNDNDDDDDDDNDDNDNEDTDNDDDTQNDNNDDDDKVDFLHLDPGLELGPELDVLGELGALAAGLVSQGVQGGPHLLKHSARHHLHLSYLLHSLVKLLGVA